MNDIATSERLSAQDLLHKEKPKSLSKEDVVREQVDKRLFQPRRDCEPFELTPPIDWEARQRKADRNWRMQLQGWTVFHPLMLAYDDTEYKQAIIDFYLDVARDWWQHYENTGFDAPESRMPDSYAWYDMSVGFRSLVIAFFRNRIALDGVSISEEMSQILDGLHAQHIKHLETSSNFSLNNHGLWQIHGLVALLKTSERAAESDFDYAMRRMEELVCQQFDERGIHSEHSPHYHFYSLNIISSVVDTGWYDSSDVTTERLRLARRVQPWIVDPLRRPFCVGDSVLTEQNSVSFPRGREKARTGTESELGRFEKSGYGIVRSPWVTPPEDSSMLFFHGAYNSKAHKHKDCLSFEWFSNGERLICDGGKYGYQSDRFRRYVLSQSAHNSLEIEGFNIMKLKPYGSVVDRVRPLGGGVYRLTGALEFPAFNHRRVIFYAPERWLLIIDHFESERPRQITQWLHFAPGIRLEKFLGNTAVLVGEKNRVQIDSFTPKANLAFYEGDEHSMNGFASARDYHIEPCPTLGLTLKAKKSKLVTCLSLDDQSRMDAMGFLGRTQKSKYVQGRLAEIGTESKPLVEGVPHGVAIDRLPDSVAELPESTFTSYRSGLAVNSYVRREKKGLFGKRRRLVVLLPGATNRNKGDVDIQRHSWAVDIKADVLAFADPTIRPENDLTLGWFQGVFGQYGIEAIRDVIRDVIQVVGCEERDLLIFGSSGGGFGALKLGEQFPDATVAAINPQIYLYRYSRQFYERMLAVSYPGRSPGKVKEKFSDRLEVSPSVSERQGSAVVFQNRADEAHMGRHLGQFLSGLEGDKFEEMEWHGRLNVSNPLNVVYYNDPGTGHSPPDRETTMAMLNAVMEVTG